MPEHPQYGCGLLGPPNVEAIRAAVEREVRRTFNDLAPGVNPGIILDILVDVNVQAQTQAQIQLNMSAIHTVSFHEPVADIDLRNGWRNNAEGNWAASTDRANQDDYSFRQEYMGTPFNGHDDQVDALYTAMSAAVGVAGVDLGHGPDQTAYTTMRHIYPDIETPHGRIQGERVRVPEFDQIGSFLREGLAERYPTTPVEVVQVTRDGLVLHDMIEVTSNPTIRLNDIRSRRFNLIDREPADKRSIHELHPWIAAVIRAKAPHPRSCTCDDCLMSLCGGPVQSQEPPKQGRSVWQRIREDYALFE